MKSSFLENNAAHLRHGAKTGLAAIMAYGVTELLELRMGFWAVLSAVIVMQIYVADSVGMCLHRLTGTAVGACIGVLALLLFPQGHLSMGLALFLSVAFCAYMTRFSPRYRMAAITVVIILLAGSGSEHPLVYSYYRILEIGIGVACAFLVSVLVWPVKAGAELKDRLQRQFNDLAEICNTINEAFLSKQQTLPEDLLQEMDAAVIENKSLLDKAQHHERIIYDEDIAFLSRQSSILECCVEHMHSMLMAVNTAQGKGFSLIMEEELRSLAHASRDAMLQLGSGGRPEAFPLRRALLAAQKRLQELREEGLTKRFDLRKLLQIMAYLNSIQALAEELLRGGNKEVSRQGKAT